MGQRLALDALLNTLCPNVYFQPPKNVQMHYPCIVYNRDSAETEFADNKPYRIVKRYRVTVIDRNPDSDIPEKVAQLPRCTFSTFFAADNLNHDVYTIFY